MLLDTVERHDPRKTIKMVCIEALKATGQKVPPQVTVVPALLLLPSKELLLGKHVFDYLLLPGKGKLLTMVGGGAGGGSNGMEADGLSPDSEANQGDPVAYSLNNNCMFSDAFSSIESDEPEAEATKGLDDRSYAWTNIEAEQQSHASVFANSPIQEETRSKKPLPDIDALRSQRDLELTQSDLNKCQLTPPSFTR